MRRRELLKGSGLLALAPGWTALQAAPGAARGREVLLLDQGWRFHEGDIPFPTIRGHGWTYANAKAGNAQGAASPNFDDSEWPEVRLPHDFAILQPLDREANGSQGYRRRGIAWYRTGLRLDPADRGRHLELQIDGAATHATVWFNGTLVHHNFSGYNGMAIDLTPYARHGEALNSLVLRVDAQAMEGWWYEGAGLYRGVRLVQRAATHIATDGVFAHPVQRGLGWVVPVEVTLNTIAETAQPVTVSCELHDERGLHARAQAQLRVQPLRPAVARLTLAQRQPRLWSPEQPHLYRVVTRVLQGGAVLDEQVQHCGFRSQHFDVNRGFFLNGRPLKIQGVCLHQDHAGVGVAVPPALVEWRLKQLKALGCNAIRGAHNAQDAVFMDACDRLGLLVMAENRLFNPAPQYLEQQLRWLVRRDRSHPCVFMWSVFNEEPMQGTAAGYEMARRLRDAVRELDTTRPVTAAMNDGLDTPLNVSHAVDVLGFNYQQDRYDPVHAARPQLPLISSEDTSAYLLRGYHGPTDKARQRMAGDDEAAAEWGATHRQAWQAIASRPFIAGGFVWSGFDYHGEPTPFEWPSNSSLFGILDLCGFAKTAAHIHRAQWLHDRPVLAIAQHWTWPGREGQPVAVMVCSNLDEVALRLNGRELGRQKVDPWAMNHWQVPYEPGTLEAVGWRGGQEMARTAVHTAGPAQALQLLPDRATMAGDGLDVQPVTVQALDAQGRFVPLAQHLVRFEIEGGAIIGLGNGDSNSLEPEQGDRRSLFNGLAQVIVRPEPGPRVLRLRALAEGLQPALAEIALQPLPPPRRAGTVASVQLLEWWQRSPLLPAPPDALLRPPPQDMNSWEGAHPGDLFKPAPTAGYLLCGYDVTPFNRVQKQGGWLECLSVSGRCEVFADGRQLGAKTERAAAPLKLALPPGDGVRRIAVVFQLDAGEVAGFGDAVRIAIGG